MCIRDSDSTGNFAYAPPASAFRTASAWTNAMKSSTGVSRYGAWAAVISAFDRPMT